MWSWFAKWKERRAQRKRTEKVLRDCHCYCKCAHCDDILNDQADCVDDPKLGVIYTCGECGLVSVYDFDLPCPMLIGTTNPLENDRVA